MWVLNQTDGTVSRIDPLTNEVVATIQVGVPGPGGDIAAGAWAVWSGQGSLIRYRPEHEQSDQAFRPRAGERCGQSWRREGGVSSA